MRTIDLYSLLGFILAIALAIFSPSFPKISSAISIITGLIIFVFLVLAVILLNLYLEERKQRKEITLKANRSEKELKEISSSIAFLKEKFKTLEDLAYVRAKIDILEKKITEK